jgi:hypothetical protein
VLAVSDENLVVERVVPISPTRELTVRISQDTTEDFWRVDVSRGFGGQRHVSTTVAPCDSFMMDLVRDAMSGEQLAWRDIARWGQTSLSRSELRFA